MAKHRNEAGEEQAEDIETGETAEASAESAERAEDAGEVEPSMEGLVKMHKDGKHIHAHPTTVEHHKQNGWSVA